MYINQINVTFTIATEHDGVLALNCTELFSEMKVVS